MKKSIMLYTFTGLAIAVIFLTGAIVKKSFIKVSAVKLVPSTAQNTVTCMGKVEAAGESKLYAHRSGIVKKIYVQSGEKVSVGQSIMLIHPVAVISQDLASQASSEGDSDLVQEMYSAYLNGTSSTENQSSSEVSDSEESTSESTSSNDEDYLVKADVSGIIQSLATTKENSYISKDIPAVVIRKDNSVRVRLSVSESQVADLKEGQKVQITGAGFRDETYTGSIESISSEAKQIVSTTGQETVVEVIATVNHPSSDIRPGFTATAKIDTSQSDHILIVPYEAVREDEANKEYVFCVKGNCAKKIYIQTGQEFDSGFEVVKGLQSNDIVILDPDDVQDNSRIIATLSASGEN